jgi:hypothetical protein
MGKHTAPTKGYETSFIIKIAMSNSVAYLWATVPQVYVDPQLAHHVKFPSRQYPNAFWYITPLCIITFLFTLMVMRKRRSTLLGVLPFIIAVVTSIPIFTPEVPHGHLFTVGFIWTGLATFTLWIRNRVQSNSVIENIMSPNLSDKTARIEYLKEEVQFWRVIILGSAGGYIALLISWASFMANLNKSIVGGNEAEAFILHIMTAFGLGLCSIGIIIGPLAEASEKHRHALNLFLKIKEKEL